MTEQQPQTIINGEIHVHGLMSPEQIAEVIRHSCPGIPSPSAEAAEATKRIADDVAAGLAKAFDENLHAVRLEANRQQYEAEQSIAAYTRNSTNERVVAQRWDGTKDSTNNIVKWLTRHGEEVWVQHDKLHARNLNSGATHAIKVGDWVVMQGDKTWGVKNHHFRRYFTWGDPQEKLTPTAELIEDHMGRAGVQRAYARSLIETLGDRGAMRLLLDVAGEIDLEHC